jgi:hypothetical protein
VAFQRKLISVSRSMPSVRNCVDISEFESYMPSHAVGSLWRVYPVHGLCEHPWRNNYRRNVVVVLTHYQKCQRAKTLYNGFPASGAAQCGPAELARFAKVGLSIATPAANFSRTPSSRPRASTHSRVSACALCGGGRRWRLRWPRGQRLRWPRRQHGGDSFPVRARRRET